MLGREYVLSSSLSINNTCIAIVQEIFILLSYTILDFRLFSDGAVDEGTGVDIHV